MPVPVPDETILGLIASQPQHGYEILAHFNASEKLAWIWNISASQVYAVLNRLEKQDLIEGKTIPQKDAPAKKEYAITPQGDQRLMAWLLTPEPSSSIRRVRIEFSSRIYLARLLGLPEEDIIRFQRLSLEQRIRQIEHQYQTTTEEMERMMTGFILGQLKSALEWVDQLDRDPSSQAEAR
jgi:DNA-binding PadR family transcriptional regulator